MGTRQNFKLQTHDAVEVLSANREFTKLIALGSRTMKIYGIEEDHFKFVTDFRAQRARKHQLDSPTYVDWSSLVGSLIATTFSSDIIVLWDVEKETQHQMYQTHGYTPSRVRFHRFESFLLVGAAKNTIVLYDTRDPTAAKKLYKDSAETVHDLQFGVHEDQKHTLVVSDIGGMLNFFDIRAGDRPFQKFVTHQGVTTVNFDPSFYDRGLVVTGGRDNFLRVWSWKQDKEKSDSKEKEKTESSKGSSNAPIYTVDAYNPVSRVFWRPGFKYHVASCPYNNDTNIYIWDVRRPFIPFAVFSDHDTKHKDHYFADMIWNTNVDDRFVSAGHNGVIVMHFVENAEHPINYVRDVALDTSPNSDFAFSVSSQLRAKNEALEDDEKRHEGIPTARRRRQFDPFQSWAKSHLVYCVPKELDKEVSAKNFKHLAMSYKFSGGDVKTLCDYNTHVAESISLFHIAQMWRTVAVLASMSPDFVDSKTESGGVGPRFLSASFAGRKDFRPVHPNAIASLFAGQVASAGCQSSDFFFGYGEFNPQGLKAECFDLTANERFVGSIPPKAEAFQPYVAEEFINLEDSPFADGYLKVASRRREALDGVTPLDRMSVDIDRTSELFWSPFPILHKILDYYSELGDVQTCATILLVLGENATKFINSKIQILWFIDYIELLDRLELFVTSAEVIKRCWFPSVSGLSLQQHARAGNLGVVQELSPRRPCESP